MVHLQKRSNPCSNYRHFPSMALFGIRCSGAQSPSFPPERANLAFTQAKPAQATPPSRSRLRPASRPFAGRTATPRQGLSMTTPFSRGPRHRDQGPLSGHRPCRTKGHSAPRWTSRNSPVARWTVIERVTSTSVGEVAIPAPCAPSRPLIFFSAVA